MRLENYYKAILLSLILFFIGIMFFIPDYIFYESPIKIFRIIKSKKQATTTQEKIEKEEHIEGVICTSDCPLIDPLDFY